MDPTRAFTTMIVALLRRDLCQAAAAAAALDEWIEKGGQRPDMHDGLDHVMAEYNAEIEAYYRDHSSY